MKSVEGLNATERARMRKQKSRSKLAKTEGINRFELQLTDRELAVLESGRAARNPGREPYSRNEYIALLLLNDEKALKVQEMDSPPCKKCGAQPPEHCDRAFKGEATCWLSYDCLALNLTTVTGHSVSDGEV